MTGYQEILTDPSYAGQIINFTFPHIGNVGVNLEDREAVSSLDLRGVVMRTAPSAPSNWRAVDGLDHWLASHGVIGIAGVDTRALTVRLRERGFLRAAIAHKNNGESFDAFDVSALHQQARDWSGLENMELARSVSSSARGVWQDETLWQWPQGFGKRPPRRARFHVAAPRLWH